MKVEQLIDLARNKVKASQANFTEAECMDVSILNDKIESAFSRQSTEISLKIINNDKLGSSSATDFNDNIGLLNMAIEAASFGNRAFFRMPEPVKLHPVKIHDAGLLSLDLPEMIKSCRQIINHIKAYNKKIHTEVSVSKCLVKSEHANSSGVSFSADSTKILMHVSGQIAGGNDILRLEHNIRQRNRTINIENEADKLIRYFRLAEKNARVKSGKMPVVFTPRAFIDLLDLLTTALDGNNVNEGSSPLKDRIGQQIAVENFTLINDPLIDYAPNSTQLDREGIPGIKYPFVENGILKNFYYDLYAAGRAGKNPSVGPSNLVIQAGITPKEKMLGNIKSGLLVHNFLSIEMGNILNGDFSVNVSPGFKIENGEITGRVKDTMLTGNVYQVLKNITGISSEREWVDGQWLFGLIPYIQVEDLSVTAE